MDASTVVGLRDDRGDGLYLRPRLRRGEFEGRGLTAEKRWWLRLRERNGKVNEMSCHHAGGLPRRLHRRGFH
jgi:hypothetical protein